MAVARTFVYPRVVAMEVEHDEAEDREMVCDACSARIFSSRAPSLAANGFLCPRCLGPVTLVPGNASS